VANSDYESAGLESLHTPPADALTVAKTLRKLGFFVDCHGNLSRAEFQLQFKQFLQRARTSSAPILLYYSGHGAQVNGRSVLVTTGSPFRKASDFRSKAISVAEDIFSPLSELPKTPKIIMLDACRTLPFIVEDAKTKALTKRAQLVDDTGLTVVNGLAAVESAEQPPESLVSFAAITGTPALDQPVSADGAGVYASAFATHATTGGEIANAVFQRIRASVLASTKQRQVTIEYDKLQLPVYLAGRTAASRPRIDAATLDIDLETQRHEINWRNQVHHPEGRQVRLVSVTPANTSVGRPRIMDGKLYYEPADAGKDIFSVFVEDDRGQQAEAKFTVTVKKGVCSLFNCR
jgi:uncharacterized caspase-like protein